MANLNKKSWKKIDDIECEIKAKKSISAFALFSLIL